MNTKESDRRSFLKAAALAGSAVLVGSCGTRPAANGGNTANATTAKAPAPAKPDDKDVTPIEDLMREHGVLRRALFVFSEAAVVLPSEPAANWIDAIQKAAKLFRAFGEDYHERKLEEQYIFPLIRQKSVNGPAGSYPDILTEQHNRGREITDYILAATAAGKVAANAGELAKALQGFVRMYIAHAAHEDTIVFPAWKGLLTENEYDDLGDKFEDIEQEQFGEDGFDDAVRQMLEIETSVGLADISKFTPPAPPAVK